MSQFHISITPRDPLVVRDGRPFGDGQQKMRPLEWPYPQLVAGAIRTMAGKAVGAYRPRELNAIRVRGPLPVRGGTLYLPIPADLVCDPHGVLLGSRPQAFPFSGCNLPVPLTLPCTLPGNGDFKPGEIPPFWPLDAAVKWLTEKELKHMPGSAMSKLCLDERLHTAINPERQASEDEHLFSTTGLSFPEGDSLAATVEADGEYAAWLSRLRATHPLGGERRLASWQASNAASSALWDCPADIRTALSPSPSPRRVRMTLATPAIWLGGWLPQWAASGHVVPGTDVHLRLVGACVPRFRPVSGYCIEAGRRGPKAVRWMAPAGSTYFFETVGDSVPVARLADLWLRPVPDSENETQDQRDGFGLALWGIWKDHEGR